MEHCHTDLLHQVRSALPSEGLLERLAQFYKNFGDLTRMKILFALFESELCVCALAELLGMEQSAISHQLHKLKTARLVCCRREGKTIYYRLSDEHIKTLISMGFAHLTEEAET